MKRTRNGKALAPVVDIFPQLCQGFHDRERIAEEMRLLRELGFERVYFVLCNPGYPQFSKPQTALLPPDPEADNHAVHSIIALGDPNWVYIDECRRHGMSPWAVYKPYECGGGITIPHGAKLPLSRRLVEDVGGERVHLDELLSRRPDLRLARRPDPDEEERRRIPVVAIELAFCLDPFRDRRDYARFFEFAGIADGDVPAVEAALWTSRDNGRYVPYGGSVRCTRRIERRAVADANGIPVGEPKRCLVLTLDGFRLPPEERYFAVTLSDWRELHTIPFSMVKTIGPAGELPVTVGLHFRGSSSPREAARPPETRDWSYGGDRRADMADDAGFREWGFEFEWHGAGRWGEGWCSRPVYGIARGKMPYMKGTPCEAHEEVQEYWLETVRRAALMGCDGVDIRLQNHSGMLSDFVNYGYNEPIVRRYREKHGVDILRERVEPLALLRVRGEFFEGFLRRAAEHLHSVGVKLQVHLRNCHEEPKVSGEDNELGFWAMPRILLDWRAVVDLADEITIKDYYHNDYRPDRSRKIKSYALETGKPLWVHCYISQGGELNDSYFDAVEADRTVGGVLLYEVAHAQRGATERNMGLIEQVGPVGYHEPAVTALRAVMERLAFR